MSALSAAAEAAAEDVAIELASLNAALLQVQTANDELQGRVEAAARRAEDAEAEAAALRAELERLRTQQQQASLPQTPQQGGAGVGVGESPGSAAAAAAEMRLELSAAAATLAPRTPEEAVSALSARESAVSAREAALSADLHDLQQRMEAAFAVERSALKERLRKAEAAAAAAVGSPVSSAIRRSVQQSIHRTVKRRDRLLAAVALEGEEEGSDAESGSRNDPVRPRMGSAPVFPQIWEDRAPPPPCASVLPRFDVTEYVLPLYPRIRYAPFQHTGVRHQSPPHGRIGLGGDRWKRRRRRRRRRGGRVPAGVAVGRRRCARCACACALVVSM